MQEESDRRDSALAAQLTQVLTLQRQANDSLAAVEANLLTFRGETLGQLYDFQKQLLQVQELAARFGGGGHAMAAGCTVDAGMQEAQQQVFEIVSEVIGAARQ